MSDPFDVAADAITFSIAGPLGLLAKDEVEDSMAPPPPNQPPAAPEVQTPEIKEARKPRVGRQQTILSRAAASGAGVAPDYSTPFPFVME